MLKKILKALPFVLYLLKSILIYDNRKTEKEKKTDVQNP